MRRLTDLLCLMFVSDSVTESGRHELFWRVGELQRRLAETRGWEQDHNLNARIWELTDCIGQIDKQLVEHERTQGSVHVEQRLSTVTMTEHHDVSMTSAVAGTAYSALGASTAGKTWNQI